MEKFKEFWKKSTGNKVIVIVIALIIIGFIGSIGNDKSSSNEEVTTKAVVKNDSMEADDDDQNSEVETEIETEEPTVATVKVADLSGYSKKKAEKWCEKHNLYFESSEEYNDKVAAGKFVSQSVKAGKKIEEGSTIEVVYSLGKKPSKEEENALKKAQQYSDTMYMSKQGIYDQLTSEYGEGFDAEAAQYAVDNLDADYKKNALEKAKTYQDTMAMSKSAIYDQLISEYGEQFTAKEAQYAIDHLDD